MEQGKWKEKDFWVSHYNYLPEILASQVRPPEVIAHDSTLRDGEQAPGVSFNVEQKVQIAKMLDEIGVQYIEAGFPAVSEQDQKSIKAITSLNLKAKITCLSRAIKKDIQLAVDCGVWGAIVEVPTGHPRLKYQFGWSEDEVLKKTLGALEYAAIKNLNIILFLIDATRASYPFIHQLVTRAQEFDVVKKLSIVDTLGAASPEAIVGMVKKIREDFTLPLEVHCHNDFGLGTANTIAALFAGVESFACTINGMGQRAGNAPLEDVVLALTLLYGMPCSLRLDKIRELSTYIQEITKIEMPQYKAVVGNKIFNWEAGIPTAALRKYPLTVEPYLPHLIGDHHTIVLGKQAGKANIIFKMEEHGLTFDDELVDAMVVKVKELAQEKNDAITDEEFLQAVKKHRKS